MTEMLPSPTSVTSPTWNSPCSLSPNGDAADRPPPSPPTIPGIPIPRPPMAFCPDDSLPLAA
ncbi:hypothetical protein CNX65_08610 [Actinosynnema pretiosum]|uniref:Uncharacterized protein n=1 Tax=Actinosynnema pretiosum TaxID=42197 RepID=A0A290Z2S6_9PSEU|nr:hypothetical protein CNX65_08610 [Actinosynnema pretiosum]